MTVYYVDGSVRRSVLDQMGALAGFVMMGMPVVVVEPRGLRADGSLDEAEARRSDTKPRRVADELAAIEASSKLHPTRHVLLLGASEGGDIAAAAAARDHRVTHLILLGAGGGLSQAEELELFVRRDPKYLGIGGDDALARQLAAIRGRPDALEPWLGHPFRRWSSYLDSPLGRDVQALDIPVLAVHGRLDQNVPVESSRKLSENPGSSKLTYVELAALDHRFRDSDGQSGLPCVEMAVASWLGTTNVIAPGDASDYVDRVQRNHSEARGPLCAESTRRAAPSANPAK